MAKTKNNIENENNAFYYYERGLAYYSAGNYQEAINNFNKAIYLDPNNPYFYNSRGDAYFGQKEFQKAFNDYKIATKLNPNNSYFYYNKGLAYYCTENYQEAINNFNKAINLDPNISDYYGDMGASYYLLKKYQEAINNFNKAIDLDPSNVYYYCFRGASYRDSENYNKAIENFNKAIDLDPDNASYYYYRGVSYYLLKKYQEAIKDFNKAIELNPNNDSFYIGRWLIYRDLGDHNKATKDFDKAIELDPNNVSYFNGTGVVHRDLENYNETIKDFNKAIESKYYSDFYDALALHLSAETNEDFQKVVERFSSFINKYQVFPDKTHKLEFLLKEAYLYLIASKRNTKRFNGYLIFADILGWKGIWKKYISDKERIDIVNDLIDIRDELKSEEKNCSLNLISDTFIISSSNFEMSNKISKKLVELCLERKFVIRGAISYGECYNKGTVYVGPAVDEAASWHDVGEEIGIFYTPSARLSIQNKINFEDFNLLKGEIKLKSGKLETFFINWYSKETKKNFYNIMKNEIITPDISSKYFNTEKKLNKYVKDEIDCIEEEKE